LLEVKIKSIMIVNNNDAVGKDLIRVSQWESN